MPTAGLIYGNEFHFLDHLAPLCALAHIPLILTDDQLASQASIYYPDLEILHWNLYEAPDQVVKNFDTIIYSTPRILFEQVFFFAQKLQKKKLRTIWCPHGNSDKGRNSLFMEGLKDEEILLTYGPRIEKFLLEKNISVPVIRLGNYRYTYFQKHKMFYQNLFPPKQKTTLLYAPTWQDSEKNSSFPNIWTLFLKTPSKYELFIQLHPHLFLQYPKEIEMLKTKIPKNVHFLENVPSIYPILERTDLLIGDKSSICYDYLTFQKPFLLLLDSDLAKIGKYVPQNEYSKLFSHVEEQLETPFPETSLYEETFDEKQYDVQEILISNELI